MTTRRFLTREQLKTGAVVMLRVPQDAAEALTAWAASAGITDVTPLADMHVTLAYLGEAADLWSVVESLQQELSWVAQWYESMPAKIAGVGRFSGETEDPFYANVDAPLISRLRERVVAAVRDAGAPVMMNHGFTPHITLSYLSTTADTPTVRMMPIDTRFTELVLLMGNQQTVYQLGVREGLIVDMKQFAARLSAHIEQAGDDRAAVVAKLAQAAAIEVSAVEQLLAGEGEMPVLETVTAFAQVLGTTPKALTQETQTPDELDTLEDEETSDTLPVGREMQNVPENPAQFLAFENYARIGDRDRVELTFTSEMRGNYPDIPLPTDIDLEALGEGRNFFITLPIGQVDARSRNGRTYRRSAVESFVRQINRLRPEGFWGHIPDHESGDKYPTPELRWLVATIDGAGTAWGKAIVLTQMSREYYRIAKATNARVGTSLVAWAQMDGDNVIDMELLSVDAADPARVGIPMAAALVQISSEMTASNQDQPLDEADGDDVESRTSADDQPVTELNQHSEENPDMDELLKAQEQARAAQKRVQELERTERQYQAVIAELQAVPSFAGGTITDPVIAVTLLLTEMDALREENRKLLETEMDAEIAKHVPVEWVRGSIRKSVEQLKPSTRDEVRRAVNTVLNGVEVKDLLKHAVQREMGENQAPVSEQQIAEKIADKPRQFFRIPGSSK